MSGAAWEKQCYGCSAQEFLASVRNSLTMKLDSGDKGAVMVAMSLLSDAQEEIERGMTNEARQTINRAKLWIDTHFGGRKASA